MKKNKKKKINIFKIIILIIIIVISIFLVKFINSNEYKLNKKGYTKEEREKITNFKNVKNIDYFISDNTGKLKLFLKVDGFNEENLAKYIEYNKKYDDLSNEDVVNAINNGFELINYKFKNEYLRFKEQKYYIPNNLEKYIKYYNEFNEEKFENIIRNINTNIDRAFYTGIKDTDMSKKDLIIVNKYYTIHEYLPDDLTTIPNNYNGNGGQLSKHVVESYIKMVDAIRKDGMDLEVVSAFRDYNKQDRLYNYYKDEFGLKYADTWSARPGHSEHQTGLTLDVTTESIFYENMAETKEYEWLKENAHKYGFIERYPLNKEKITGYSFEPWHYRYIGVEHATKLREENITFDEYYAFYLDK